MHDPRISIEATARLNSGPHDVVVRTANVHETSERYGKINVPRLAGIARRFRLDDPEQVGLIGITEPTRKIKQCLSPISGTTSERWPIGGCV
jgi:hypothetical protein